MKNNLVSASFWLVVIFFPTTGVSQYKAGACARLMEKCQNAKNAVLICTKKHLFPTISCAKEYENMKLVCDRMDTVCDSKEES